MLRHLGEMLETPGIDMSELPDVRRRLMGTVTAVKWLVEGPPLISDRLLRSEGGQYIFIGIMPPKDYGTLGVIERPVRIVRELLEQARAEFPEVQMGLTGKPVLQADEMATSDRDMTRAALLAIILVAIMIMLVLGAIWHPLLAMAASGGGRMDLWTGRSHGWPAQSPEHRVHARPDRCRTGLRRTCDQSIRRVQMLQRSGGIGTRSVQDRHEGKRVRSHDVERDLLRGMVH